VVASVQKTLEKLGVVAERNGRRWWAEQCPLPSHGAPNPKHQWQNFFVRDNDSERPGQWHCFSCKAGGTLVDLVMEMRGVDVDEAREWLRTIGEQAAPPILRVRFEPVGPRRFRMPAGVEFGPLARWNSVARQYVECRGITADQVERWGIGYALEGRLDGRIVFPIRNRAGELANYAARTFVGDEVRYLAAHESEHPDLSAMWGEHRWPAARADRMVVVFEGITNGLAIERAWNPGSSPALAGLQGSAIEHRKLARLASFQLVLVATDPDRAGEHAAREIASALGPKVRRLRYPTEQDAAETPRDQLAEVLRRHGAFDP